MPNTIGQPLTRVDGRMKVTGKATYSAEFDIPNLAHAVLVMSTIPKGRITSIDQAAAERVPGVLAILTHRDKLKLAKDPMDNKNGEATDRSLPLMQDDRVYFAGQPVAVAVATSFEAAREAASLVRVSYTPEPFSVNLQHGMASAFIPEKMGGGDDKGESSRGDIDAGLAQASAKIKNVYSTPFQTHNPMEPHATIAVWDGPDRLTLYDATQGIFNDRKRTAGLLGLEPENVRVVSLFLGGGFGSKGPTWSHSLLCAMAARRVNRPVKLVLMRRQMFGPIGFRSETRQEITAAAQSDGRLTALSNEVYCHTSSFDQFVESASLPTRMLYSVPNNKTVQRVVRSDIGTPSFMRAPGESAGTATLEIAMDELAYALKIDPVALRLKNYAEQDEEKHLPWSTKGLRECYRIGAEKFGWAKRTPEPRSMRDGNTLVGWGMSTLVYPARRNAASARARMNADGTVLVDAGTQDLGTGTYTTMTQIAADGLGVDASRVTFRLGDTRYPETPVSGGSMTSASTGSAVDLAARALRDKIRALQDAQPGVRSDEPLEAIVKRSGQPYIEAEVDKVKQDENARKSFSMYSFGALFAEVRVDADLGQVKASRLVGVFAPGRILNAKTARSQFLGGMVWSVSFALYEHSVYDERLGRVVNNNLAEYHVPTNADIGSMEAYWIDEDDRKVSTIGAKGIGEIGNTGAAAIANAVYHATGKRVRDFPITLDKLIA